DLHRHARLERGDALDQRPEVGRRERGLRQAREARVGVYEAREAVGARADDLEAAAHVVLPIWRPLRVAQQRAEAARDRFDRGEGVVQFVAEHADDALPRLQLLLAQRAAEVGDDDEVVRAAALAKFAAPHAPAADGAGKREVQQARGVALERFGQAELGRI